MQYSMKKFKDLTSAELYDILKLRQEVFIIEQTCIYPDIDDKDQNAVHLMAFDGNQLVGCLRILEKGVTFEEVSIGRVVMAPSHRRTGIAKCMMQQALDFISQEWRETRVKISAQSYTIPFYAGVGFEVMSKEYLEDDIPHVDMVWRV
ncbi:MAG: GNAT family N-acetyltransferase [Oscillospiraceae bacterium]|nr:GNAT family N-acetyltransferase [Oscillospiraceae bacterium]